MNRGAGLLLLPVALAMLAGWPALVLGAPAGAGSAGAYLKTGMHAAGLAMGGAYTAACQDASAAYWNPAGLGCVRREALLASYGVYPSHSDYTQLMFSLPLELFAYPPESGPANRYGTLGFTFVRFSASDTIEARQTDSLNPDYLFSDIEGTYGLAYGLRIWGKLLAGLHVKGLYHILDRTHASGFGVDAGLLWQEHPRLNLALAVRDAWTQLAWETGIREFFPATVKAGAAYQVPVLDRQDLLLTLDVEQSFTSRPLRLRGGLEYAFFETLFARAGYDDGVPTIGAGIRLHRTGWGQLALQLDYAAVQDRITGWDHWFTVRLDF